MGHASLDMLLKRYGHFTDETRREAILKFDRGYANGMQTQKWDFGKPASHCKIKRGTGLEPATFSLGS